MLYRAFGFNNAPQTRLPRAYRLESSVQSGSGIDESTHNAPIASLLL
jgi:hypothetical protein